MTTAAHMIDLHRRAAELVGAAYAHDEDGVRLVLTNVAADDAGQFLTALAQFAGSAFDCPPSVGMPAFLAAYADSLDATERQLAAVMENGTHGDSNARTNEGDA